MRFITLLCAALCCAAPALAALAAPVAQEGAPRVPLLDHKQLQLGLHRLETVHPTLATILGVGQSSSGRRIEAVRLASGDLGDGRPAILVVGGLEGPEAWNSGLVLELADELAKGYAEDARVQRLLDSTTVYLIPRANPDACEQRFGKPLMAGRASGAGGDEDRDARTGEDGPSDVNGDGVIGWMRVPDPLGTWLPDEVDPRVLVEAEGLERGRWRLVPEGVDVDHDGEIAEDPALDVEVNRNFAAGFEEHVARAGAFPTSEPESRALCDFVLAHRDIQLVLIYGELDNLADPGDGIDDDAPDSKRVPAAGVRKSDAQLLGELAERYREATGDDAGGDEDDDAGTFSRWCYAHRGLLTLSIDAWDIPLEDTEGEADAPEPCDDARRLAWLEARGVDAHLGWTSFDHPTLGQVELGGFRPFALTEPPTEERAALLGGQREFLVSLTDDLARVTVTEATWTNLGGGTLSVHATLVNEGLLPLLGVWGQRTRSSRPARVELLLPEGARVLAGKGVQLVDDLAGRGGRQELRWLVAGAPPGAGVGVLVETDHAGGARVMCKEESQ